MPDLSICIIAYNIEDYIDENLASVFAQKTKYSFEILIGDDGSTDGTIDKIIEWQKKYPKVITYYQMDRDKNKNYRLMSRVSHNRVNLMLHAKGKYITFLDGDDVYKTKDFFEKAIKTLNKKENEDCSVYAGNTEAFWGIGRCKKISSLKTGKIELSQYWEEMYTHSGACIYRNKFFFDVRLRQYFDDNIITFLALTNGKLYAVKNTVISLRQRGKSFWLLSDIEQALYNFNIYSIICQIAPQYRKISNKRYANTFEVINQHMPEITVDNYPHIYLTAKEINSEILLKIFMQNNQISKENVKEKIYQIAKNILKPVKKIPVNKTIIDENMKNLLREELDRGFKQNGFAMEKKGSLDVFTEMLKMQ